MLRYNISLSNPQTPVRTFTLFFSSYSYGQVGLQLAESPDAHVMIREMYQIIESNSLSILSDENNNLWIKDAVNARIFYEFLVSKGVLTDSEHAELADILRQTDIRLEERQQLKVSATTAENELLLSVAEIYFQYLVERAKDYRWAIFLFACSFSPAFKKHHLLIANHIQQRGGENDLVESIEGLWKILHGHGNMESTFIRYSKQLPILLLQRRIIFDAIINLLNEKFSTLSDKERLHMILGILLYRAENQLLPANKDICEIIDIALLEEAPSEINYAIFNGPQRPGILPLLTESFRYMGILSPEGIQLDRIRELQRTFQSPILGKYLQDLENAENNKNSPLEKALRENNLPLVTKIINENPGLINQFLSYGKTPLLLAVEFCDKNVVEFLLNAGANVNLPSQQGFVSPIGAAIFRNDFSIVQLLLNHGSFAFHEIACVLTSASRPLHESTPTPVVISGVMDFVIDYYKREPNHDKWIIMAILIQFGSCLGYNFPMSFDYDGPALPYVVAIGGSFPTKKINNVCTNFQEFIQFVPKDDYQHWVNVLSMFVYYENQKENKRLPLILECQKIIDFISLTSEQSKAPQAQQRTHISSPISSSGDAHESLLRMVSHYVEEGECEREFQPCIVSITAKNYGQALRRLATSDHPIAIRIVTEMFKLQSQLAFDLNEQVGDTQQTALHHAARKGNSIMYDLLVANRADETLTDSSGHTAAQILALVSQANSSKKPAH